MIHLVTVVGSYAKLLEPFLEHYRALGVESFFVHLHIRGKNDPVEEHVRDVTRRFGCGVASVCIGDWHTDVNPMLIAEQMRTYPDDWFLIADQDEFQSYPGPLSELLEESAARGFDHLGGGFVDRVAEGGAIRDVNPDGDLWEQFPWGGFVAWPIMKADPRKITAARGRVTLDKGQHRVLGSDWRRDPRHFVPVHHFKWVSDVVHRLTARAAFYERAGEYIAAESRLVVQYLERHGGRFDLSDPRLLFSRSGREDPPSPEIRAACAAYRREDEPSPPGGGFLYSEGAGPSALWQSLQRSFSQ